MTNRIRVPCPSCQAKGGDTSGDNLYLYPDSDTKGWCFVENKTVSLDDPPNKKRSRSSPSGDYDQLTMAAVPHYPICAIEDWGISKETCEKYGYRTSFTETDRQPEAHWCPSFNNEGEITGYKKRTLPKQFTVVGKLSGLVGKQTCSGSRFLLITEGEKDMLSASEMLRSEGKDYNVVSIPNGANEQGNLDPLLRRELEWIVKFEKVVICLDNDAPGRATAKALAEMLCSQTQVSILELPDGYKDINVVLQKGKAKQFLKKVWNSKPYHPEEIVEGTQLSIDELRKPKKPGVEIPFPKLQKMTWGLRKGEITLITAGTGVGKSSFVREICYDLACKGFRVANIALETVMEDSARYYVAMDNNVPAYKLMFNPGTIPEEAYKQSFDKLFATNQMMFFKHWGSLASDKLVAKCYYFAKALGVDFIMLDHISMVVAGNESKDERKDIDALFEGLTRLVTETGVGVLAVMHLKRVQGKSFNKGDEVELTDLRGCVDKDTEFLSPSGWKKISEWEGEQVMEVDKSLYGRFSIPKDHVVLPCNDGLVHIKTNRLDMMLSDEHRMVYHSEKDEFSLKEITLEKALTIHNKQSTGFRGRIPCVLNGAIDHKPTSISEASARVHVMVSADGWIRNPDTLRCSVRVKKERKKQRARELLSNYTNDWFEFDIKGGYTEFTFTAPFEKGYTGWFELATQDVLEWVADEAKYWDGEFSTGRLTSVNKDDADFIQFAYTVTGHRSPIRIRELESSFGGEYTAQNQYVVNKTDETHASFRKSPNSKVSIERVPSPDGLKYCFVTSTGAWLARRNGKIFVTGNSAGAEQMSFNVWALERDMQSDNKDVVKCRVLKNRLLGFTGLADHLIYRHDTGRLVVMDDVDY